MKTSDFYYELPEKLIAQSPLDKRDASRLLMLNRATGEVAHGVFGDILTLLKKGDALVINYTRVLPMRLLGHKKGTQVAVEFLLLKRLSDYTWETLVRPGRRLKSGAEVQFGDGELNANIVSTEVGGSRVVEFSYEGIFEEVLDKLGEMPLPPYIHEKLEDKGRYQTVYAKVDGSAAAPTAGFHFTKELLQKVQDMGVAVIPVLLHVGLGTFRPVKAIDIRQHHMHEEYYELGQDTANQLNEIREKGGRIVAVGTTSCRVLETVTDEQGFIHAGQGFTDIFIYPGYRFKAIDALITNFHLPESTLLMLVSAFAGKENIFHAYRTAIEEEYRFFSFGDAMAIF